MKILITGANGFIGKNLIAELRNRGYNDLCFYIKESTKIELESYCRECDFVFHLAGVNRPEREDEFIEGNLGLLEQVLATLRAQENLSPILLTSSLQALQDNPYGRSKREAEKYLLEDGGTSDRNVMVYRLGNVFGKWCKPNYNSVVATFCHNIARGIPIQVSDQQKEMNLIYIDDVVGELISAMEGATKPAQDGFYYVHQVASISLGDLAHRLLSFSQSRSDLAVPDMGDKLSRELYATYLSHLPEEGFSYPLKVNADDRGSFTEFIRTADRGQVSVNISKPGITKGNHWHHTKNEKFLVVSGEGLIRFRKLQPVSEETAQIIEYKVSGQKLEVVDIPTGYTHNIINMGDCDMVTIMWASEAFDPGRPDTYYLEV